MQRSPALASRAARDEWWWIFDPRLSLRARAVLVVGGSAIAFTIFATWLAGAVFHRQLETHAAALMETYAFELADKLDRNLYAHQRTLQFIASVAPFSAPQATNAERTQTIEAALDSSPDFAWLGFADPSGTLVCTTQHLLENTRAAQQPWFRAPRDRPYLGGVHENAALAARVAEPSQETSPRFVDLATAVHASTGEFLGVLVAELRWSWARDVQQSVVPDALRREHIDATVYSAAGEVLLDSGGSGWSDPPEAPSIPLTRRARGAFAENAADGTSYITGFARSPGVRDFRGLGGLVTVRQRSDAVFATVRELQRTIAIWGAVVALVLAIASWRFAGRHARRLAAVTLAADRIRGGDVLTTMPRAHDESELDRMCGAIDAMTAELRHESADAPDS
ncbi:MAG TPA: cache and HAMP domain-containing protein [Opitutaceae bacterium]|nr:cache and HAMP domain-containing protein [Opitutaceae bacterium]